MNEDEVEKWVDERMSPDWVRAELARIDKIEDPEEQGYQAAPVLCKVAGCTAWDMLMATKFGPSDGHPTNKARDVGVMRWCQEQINSGSFEA